MICTCGWRSKISISSRAAYPDAPTIATPIFAVTSGPDLSGLPALALPRRAMKTAVDCREHPG